MPFHEPPPKVLWLADLFTYFHVIGKSTFLRQNALISILAQAGSFVPAHHATLGKYTACGYWLELRGRDDEVGWGSILPIPIYFLTISTNANNTIMS